MGIHHTTDYKEHAVKYYMKCKNYVETCEVFDCERTSLMRWVKKYMDIKHWKINSAIQRRITKSNYRNYFYNSLNTTQLPIRKSINHINTHKYKE